MRPIVLLPAGSATDGKSADRLVEILARGLERMMAGKGRDQDRVDEEQAELDFSGLESVTTPYGTGSYEEDE